MSVMKLCLAFLAVSMLPLSSLTQANESLGDAAGSIKLDLYRMDQGEEELHVSSGEALTLAFGFKVLPILSLEAVVRF